jgi:hypothetical protein
MRSSITLPDMVKIIKSRRIIWARHIARIGEKIHVYKVLVRKPEEKRPLRGPKRNIKIIEIEWVGLDWIDLAQDRDQQSALVNTVTNLQVPQSVCKFVCN